MTKKKTNNASSSMKMVVLGASLAGLAATAYFFLGPKGKKNQAHTKAWAIKMKADVIEKLEMANDITEPVYHKIIDAVALKYGKTMKNNQEEITGLTQDLKKHWKTISAKAIKNKTAKKA